MMNPIDEQIAREEMLIRADLVAAEHYVSLAHEALIRSKNRLWGLGERFKGDHAHDAACELDMVVAHVRKALPEGAAEGAAKSTSPAPCGMRVTK